MDALVPGHGNNGQLGIQTHAIGKARQLMPLAMARMDNMGACGECNKVKTGIHKDGKGFKRSTSKTDVKITFGGKVSPSKILSLGRPTTKIIYMHKYLSTTTLLCA